MLTFILHRLLGALLVIFGVISIVFLLIHMIPGDPVEIMLGESASTADREALRTALGLNQPLLVQFQHYLSGLLHLDMGTSIHFRRPVADLLRERLPATATLAAVTLLLTVMMALPLGIMAAVRRNSLWDTGAISGWDRY